MNITIDNSTVTARAMDLLKRFIEMNQNGDYDYFERDNIFIGTNENSGYSYIYLESSPSIAICLTPDNSGRFVVIYSSSYDGIEFIRDLDMDSLSALEDANINAYDEEYGIRGDDYEDEAKTEEFINWMRGHGWDEL